MSETLLYNCPHDREAYEFTQVYLVIAIRYLSFFFLIFSGCAIPQYNLTRNDAYSSIHHTGMDSPNIELGQLLNYQQDRYQLEDPMGDHALLNLLHATSARVVWLTLNGDGYSKLLNDINESRDKFEYKPIGIDRFSILREPKPVDNLESDRNTWLKDEDVFIGVILDEEKNGIVPEAGVCHRWSSSYRNNPQTFPMPYMFFSKLFLALAYGESSVYFITEKEEQLAEWILKQQVRTVSLKEVFRKSYQLNSGDVYLSILTVTNVISRFWTFNDRESLPIATRLQIITSTQSDLGDNYGSWHHFWGMTLFGYCHGATSAKLVGWIESIGSHMVSGRDEPDEDYINKYAGQVGAQLRTCIDNWLYD